MSDLKKRQYAVLHRLWELADAVVAHLSVDYEALPRESAAASVSDMLQTYRLRGNRGGVDVHRQSLVAAVDGYTVSLLNDWINQLLTVQPENPLEYSSQYFALLAGRDAVAALQQRELYEAEDVPRNRVPPAPHWVPNPSPVILVLWYSAYGHVRVLAVEAARGAESFVGASVIVRRVPETLPDAVIRKMAITTDEHTPVVTLADLKAAHGIVWAFPARFGTAPAQLSTLLDATGQLWTQGALSGKAAAVIVATAHQHGGQEMAPSTLHRALLHHGMILVGPSPLDLQKLSVDTVQGCSPYAASTVAGAWGDRQPTVEERAVAFELGKRVAGVASRLSSAAT